jgi:hypothetical protein
VPSGLLGAVLMVYGVSPSAEVCPSQHFPIEQFVGHCVWHWAGIVRQAPQNRVLRCCDRCQGVVANDEVRELLQITSCAGLIHRRSYVPHEPVSGRVIRHVESHGSLAARAPDTRLRFSGFLRFHSGHGCSRTCWATWLSGGSDIRTMVTCRFIVRTTFSVFANGESWAIDGRLVLEPDVVGDLP